MKWRMAAEETPSASGVERGRDWVRAERDSKTRRRRLVIFFMAVICGIKIGNRC
jgi:hypothetical protein